MNLDKNIEEFDLVFIDLETTGLDVVTGDTICEIGAFKVKDRKVIDRFHSLINPKRPVPQQAYQVHKISDEELKNAPFFEDIVDKLMLFLDGSVVCAYNIGFDLGFINYQLKKMERPPIDLPAVDILSMARDILTLPRYNLETTARHFDIDCSGNLHRALGDAAIACKVFFKLVDMLKEKKIDKLSQLLPLYGFANEIFQCCEDKKTALIKDAIGRILTLKMKFFSKENTIEEERIIPLRLLQEGKYYYLLYQKPKAGTSRIRLNRILEIATL